MESWRKAVESYATNLTKEERELWGGSKPEDILQDFQTSQKTRRHMSKIQGFLSKVQPLVAAIERFGKPLDILANVSAMTLSPFWGSLRALLIVARDYEGYYARLMVMLQQLGDVLPRYHTYEKIFASHQPLQDVLLSVHMEILSFVIHAKKVFSKSSFRIFAKVLWKPFDGEFELSINELRRLCDLVEREAGLAHMVEASKSRMQLAELKSVVDSREQANSLAEIKRWLDARQCHVEKVGIVDALLPGSCEWIFKRPEFSDWVASDEAQIFWIHGQPGCGKSYLYSKIIEHISAKDKLVYFFFCGADKERVTVSSLLRSWVYQMLMVFPEAIGHAKIALQHSQSSVAAPRQVLSLFLSILRNIPSCILTLDALDECTDRNEFFHLLSVIPRKFKILVMSRELPDLSNHLKQQAYISLSITPAMIQADIDSFISAKLKEHEPRYDTEVSSAIKSKLSRSSGMFLWVRLMFEHIENQTCEFEILECLNELPTGLNATYDRILDRIGTLPQPKRLLAYKVFFWITIARRPLAIREMCAILAVDPSADGANAFDKRRQRVTDPESTLLLVCGSLVQARYSDKSLYPAHFTVTEYLEQFLTHHSILRELTTSYGVSQLKSSHSLATAICLRYLSSDVVSEPENGAPASCAGLQSIPRSEKPALDLLPYAALYWPQHFNHIADPEPLLLELSQELLHENKENREIFWQAYWVLTPDSKESSLCPTDFSALHIAAYFGLSHLVKVFLALQAVSVLDGMGRTPVWWAIKRSHIVTSKLLIEAEADSNEPESNPAEHLTGPAFESAVALEQATP